MIKLDQQLVLLLGLLIGPYTVGAANSDVILYEGSRSDITEVQSRALQTFTVKDRMTAAEATQRLEQLTSYTGTSLETGHYRNDSLTGSHDDDDDDGGSDLRGSKDDGDDSLIFHSRSDPSAIFHFEPRTGGLLFNKGLAGYTSENNTHGLPASNLEAVSVAIKHLKNLAFLPAKEERVVAHVGGMDMGVHRRDGSTDTYKKIVTVRFERQLDGLPVQGASRVVINLGKGGELTGLIFNWNQVEGRALSSDELHGELEIRAALESYLLANAGNAEKIVVKKSELVLYDDGSVIEPAIYVVAQLSYNSGTIAGQTQGYENPYDFYIPVLKDFKASYPFMADTEVPSMDR
jgi:hypothetical protein